MAKKSYAWFEKTRRTKLLELAQKQISTALDTVTLLNQAMQEISKAKVKDAKQHIEKLFTVEEEIDHLRTEVFKELSKGAALFADYREDLLHLVKRLDTFADHVKDAARCIVMLGDSKIPDALWTKAVHITSTLVDCATALRSSIENISANPAEAMKGAKKVEEIEAGIDREYLETKSLFIKHSEQMNAGALINFPVQMPSINSIDEAITLFIPRKSVRGFTMISTDEVATATSSPSSSRLLIYVSALGYISGLIRSLNVLTATSSKSSRRTPTKRGKSRLMCADESMPSRYRK